MSKKKSFILYFDVCRQVLALPDEQLGMLFRAVMDCAERESRGEDGVDGFIQRYPGMTDGTRMAFYFLASTIQRDTRTYREKCANYSAAAQKREVEKAKARAAEAPDSPESRQAEAAHYIRLLKDRSRAAEEEPRP